LHPGHGKVTSTIIPEFSVRSSLVGSRIALPNAIMELNVSTLAMKLKTIRMREKEITLSLNRIHINMRIMSMNSLLQDMMPSIIMIDRLHLEELISMRAPIKTLLEGDTTIGKFIRNIHEPLIFNCSSHIIMALLLTFPLVHIPPVYGPVTPLLLPSF
jgi:hypothetical protein